MLLNLDDWPPLLDPGNVEHGLLLPILAYCVDDKGKPVLGSRRPGKATEEFFAHEGYKDIALVVPAICEMHHNY